MTPEEMYKKLETAMKIGTQRNILTDPLLTSSITRLGTEGSMLLNTGRHAWVLSTSASLNDSKNWDGYAMSIHLCYQLETAGYQCSGEVKLIPGDLSDVDIVYTHDGKVRVGIECVAALEPQCFWGPEMTDDSLPGVTMRESTGEDNDSLLRRVQSKIRIKAVKEKKNGAGNIQLVPTKFPPDSPDTLNIIAVDVTTGAGTPMDWLDMQKMTRGKMAHPMIDAGDLLGLFEYPNPYDPEFAAEFQGNQFLRERVHGILFLTDTSHWRSSLDPLYDGCFVPNPLFTTPSSSQIAALNALGNDLKGLVQAWLDGVTVT